MKKRIAVAALVALVPVGFVLASGGVAGANPTLTGSTFCTMTNGFVNFLEGLATTPPNGNEKAEIEANLSCTTGNLANVPPITSLTGVFKGIIVFHDPSVPNKAQSCANFVGASPTDMIVATSHYKIQWTANGSPAVPSTVHYSGTYSATLGPPMVLSFATSTATVTGSLAGTTANLTYTLPNTCPVAPGINHEITGSLAI